MTVKSDLSNEAIEKLKKLLCFETYNKDCNDIYSLYISKFLQKEVQIKN